MPREKVYDLIGLLESKDVVGDRFMVPIDRKHPKQCVPASKAVLLLYMPTCPHCKQAKKWMERVDLTPFGIHKLAINVASDDRLAQRVTSIFDLPESYEVPRVYVIQNGRIKKELDDIKDFDPVRDYKK
jgi:hypothetical protein